MSTELKEYELGGPSAHPLNQVQTGLIKTADNDITRALTELGEAYLRHRQAQTVLKQAEAALGRCERAAHRAELDKARVMDKISTELKLPDGQYRFDREKNILVEGD